MTIEQAEAFFETFDAILLYPVFLVNVIIIVLSLKFVPPSISQIYSLNIAIPSLICAIYKIGRNIVTPYFERNNRQDVRDWLPQMLLLTTTFNIYQIQGTLTIVLTYFSFVKPILYQTYYTERTVRYFTFGGHIFSVCLATIEFPERIYKRGLYSTTLLDVHVTIRCGSQMLLFITMLLFYWLTFHQVVFGKKNVILVQTMGVEQFQKQRRAVIKSVLIYFTPPVILLVVSASGSLCIALKATMETARGLSTGSCASVIRITDHMVMLRFFVNTVSALVAFANYREGMVKMVQAIRNRLTKKEESYPESLMMNAETEAFFETFDTVLLYVVLVVNILVIFLSLKYVPPSLSQIYALNIAIPSLICAVYKTARSIITPSFECDKRDIRDWLPQVLLIATTFNIYQIQGTLTIVLTYFSFVKPIEYQKYYTERTVKFCVFGGHVIAMLLAFIEFPERIYRPELYSIKLLDIHTAFRCGTQMFLFFTMFVFYWLTFHQVVCKKHNAVLARTIGVDKFQRQRRAIMKSVLIYFTPPVILLVVSAAGSICIGLKPVLLTARGMSIGHCLAAIKITDHLVMLRFFVNTVSTLIAFTNYREGIVKMVVAIRRLFRKKSVRQSQHITSTQQRVVSGYILN